jgi:hypothetical protein
VTFFSAIAYSRAGQAESGVCRPLGNVAQPGAAGNFVLQMWDGGKLPQWRASRNLAHCNVLP